MQQITQEMLQQDLLITKTLKQQLIFTTLLSSGLSLLKFHSVLELCVDQKKGAQISKS